MGRSADLCTCIYQKQRADRAEQEVERLRCIIELNFNLTQQAQNEAERLETENEKLKELIQKSLVACTYCPNENGTCGDTCSIRESREYIKLCGEGGG